MIKISFREVKETPYGHYLRKAIPDKRKSQIIFTEKIPA